MSYVISVIKYSKGWYLKDAWFLDEYSYLRDMAPKIEWTGKMDKAFKFRNMKEAEWLGETYLKRYVYSIYATPGQYDYFATVFRF